MQECLSKGIVIESRLDKGIGPVATILIQKGTLTKSEIFVCGSQFSKVRGLLNERGEIFRPDVEQAPSNIVFLKGPAGTESEVLKHYRKLFVELGRLGLGIEAVTLSGRHAWTVETKDGRTLILGFPKRSIVSANST